LAFLVIAVAVPYWLQRRMGYHSLPAAAPLELGQLEAVVLVAIRRSPGESLPHMGSPGLLPLLLTRAVALELPPALNLPWLA